MGLTEKLLHRLRMTRACPRTSTAVLFLLSPTIAITVLLVTASTAHQISRQTNLQTKEATAPKRTHHSTSHTTSWEKEPLRSSLTRSAWEQIPRFSPIEGVLRDLGVAGASECTELLLSNGLKIRTTIFNSGSKLSKEAMLVEWLEAGSSVIQRGIYDPSIIRILPSDVAKNADVYEAIVSPELEDKIFSSLEDGSLQIRPQSSKENPVEMAMRVQDRAGSLGRVELVPFFR